METIAINQLPPGDPKLVDSIVGQLKSKGIFDRFRRECLADVDTKPAYQNLRQRVEGEVLKFLENQVWKADLNKNQLRDGVRKHVQESRILDSGIDAIINQVVNPKIEPLILPCVEEAVYSFLQIDKPKREWKEKVMEEEVTPCHQEDPTPPVNQEITPMQTDVISSEEDDLMSGPVKNQESPFKVEDENAQDGFSAEKSSDAEMLSKVEKLSLEEKPEPIKTEEIKSDAKPPLFDNQSLDSISSNSSGLNFSQEGVNITESPDKETQSKELGSTQSTPVVDEKMEVSSPEPMTSNPIPDTASSQEGNLDISKDTTLSPTITSNTEEKSENKSLKSECEITNSSTSNFSSPMPEMETAVDQSSDLPTQEFSSKKSPEPKDKIKDRDNKERDSKEKDNKERDSKDKEKDSKDKDKERDNKDNKERDSKERDTKDKDAKYRDSKDKDGKDSKDKDSKMRKSTDDHHSHRHKDKKHHRRDHDDDKDRNRGRSHRDGGSSTGHSSDKSKDRHSHHSSKSSSDRHKGSSQSHKSSRDRGSSHRSSTETKHSSSKSSSDKYSSKSSPESSKSTSKDTPSKYKDIGVDFLVNPEDKKHKHKNSGSDHKREERVESKDLKTKNTIKATANNLSEQKSKEQKYSKDIKKEDKNTKESLNKEKSRHTNDLKDAKKYKSKSHLVESDSDDDVQTNKISKENKKLSPQINENGISSSKSTPIYSGDSDNDVTKNKKLHPHKTDKQATNNKSPQQFKSDKSRNITKSHNEEKSVKKSKPVIDSSDDEIPFKKVQLPEKKSKILSSSDDERPVKRLSPKKKSKTALSNDKSNIKKRSPTKKNLILMHSSDDEASINKKISNFNKKVGKSKEFISSDNDSSDLDDMEVKKKKFTKVKNQNKIKRKLNDITNNNVTKKKKIKDKNDDGVVLVGDNGSLMMICYDSSEETKQEKESPLKGMFSEDSNSDCTFEGFCTKVASISDDEDFLGFDTNNDTSAKLVLYLKQICKNASEKDDQCSDYFTDEDKSIKENKSFKDVSMNDFVEVMENIGADISSFESVCPKHPLESYEEPVKKKIKVDNVTTFRKKPSTLINLSSEESNDNVTNEEFNPSPIKDCNPIEDKILPNFVPRKQKKIKNRHNILATADKQNKSFTKNNEKGNSETGSSYSPLSPSSDSAEEKLNDLIIIE